MSRRSERVGDLILRMLGEILIRDVKDPRIERVTLTRVDLGADLRRARVYFSVLGEEPERERAAEGLRSAAGFLQGKVARQLRLRHAPELVFELDPGPAHADHIDELLRKIRRDEG